jgi:diacylglycerol kinase (ATP)
MIDFGLLRATRHSIHGLMAAYRSERAFRQEMVLALVLIPAAFWVGKSYFEISLLIATVLLVLIVELLNSAIEACIDRISPDFHDLSKRAKDLGSAAVFLSLVLCGVVWISLLLGTVVTPNSVAPGT